MYEQTKRFVERFQPTWIDLVFVAVVDFLKTSAELITLCALFQYVAQKFNSTPAAVANFLMTFAFGIYFANRIGLATYSLLPERFGGGWWRVVTMSIQAILLVGAMLGAKEVISGVVQQLAQ